MYREYFGAIKTPEKSSLIQVLSVPGIKTKKNCNPLYLCGPLNPETRMTQTFEI